MKNIEKLGYLVGIAFPIYIGFDLHFEIGYWKALISLFGEGEQSAPFLVAHFIISTIFYS